MIYFWIYTDQTFEIRVFVILNGVQLLRSQIALTGISKPLRIDHFLGPSGAWGRQPTTATIKPHQEPPLVKFRVILVFLTPQKSLTLTVRHVKLETRRFVILLQMFCILINEIRSLLVLGLVFLEFQIICQKRVHLIIELDVFDLEFVYFLVFVLQILLKRLFDKSVLLFSVYYGFGHHSAGTLPETERSDAFVFC